MRAKLAGQRIAVAGTGVSGQAVARAALTLGANPTALDEKPNDSPAVLAAVDRLDALGVPVVTGWHGRLEPDDFDLLVVSPGFPRQHPAIRDMQRAGRPVWSEVEFAFEIAEAPILAITGTNGKSTTTVLTWAIAQSAGADAWLCGNISGSGFPERALTDAALEAGPDSLLVAEVSSFQLEWVENFAPHAATVTNVTPDHLDRHPDFEDYFATKMRIFHRLGPGQAAVLNLDEPSLPFDRIAAEVPEGAPIVGFSPSGTEMGTGVTSRDGGTLLLSGRPLNLDDLPLVGEHNVANVMTAWELATRASEPGDESLAALLKFPGLANRMERIGEREGVLVVNNSMCTNPAAVVASSRGLRQRQHLLMGGVTKNLDFTPVAYYLQGSGHRAYLFGPDTETLARTVGAGWPRFETLEAAFGAAVSAAGPGEAVLLAPGCASAEPYANFRERGDAFRSMAKAWLEAGS